jgi:hypothetical protein
MLPRPYITIHQSHRFHSGIGTDSFEPWSKFISARYGQVSLRRVCSIHWLRERQNE